MGRPCKWKIFLQQPGRDRRRLSTDEGGRAMQVDIRLEQAHLDREWVPVDFDARRGQPIGMGDDEFGEP